MSNLAVRIEQEVTQAMDKDELELPSLPEVALRIRDEISLVPSNYTEFSTVAGKVDCINVVMVANLQRVAGSSHPLNDLDWTDN